MTSPAVELEARANRKHQQLARARDELLMLHAATKRCDLPEDIKLRIRAYLRKESDLLQAELDRVDGQRQGAAISRARQWVTSGDA
jgi:hypothetical protein